MFGVLFLGPRRLTSRRSRVAGTVLAVLLGVFFLIVAIPKLMGMAFERQMFEAWGYPLWFMYAVGLAEAVFGLMLFLPQTRFWGAVFICAEMVGAALTHVRADEIPMLPLPLGTLALAAWLAWLDRPVLERLRGAARRPAHV